MPGHDRELTQRCQQGDLDAFAELLHRYRARVFRVAYAILGSRDDAEDVVQEAFVRAYRALHQRNPDSDFAAWVRRIAVNCAASRARKQQRRLRLASAGSRHHNPEWSPDPGEHAMARELQDQTRRAIARLPLKQRLAITLFGLEDMTLAETARAIGCPVGAVKLHLHRARRKLAHLLSDYLEEA